MSSDPSSPLNTRPCKHLRSREMFYDTGAVGEQSASGIFWCTHTHHCLGPDGEPATDELCRPDRGCYEQ